MNKPDLARSLLIDLNARLAQLEEIGSLVAAAHLQAAIIALCRDFNLDPEASASD